MIMKVITPGPLSTVQDGGRFGYMSTGFGSGGAMDLRAMRIANILVGNDENDGVIEMTMLGLSAEFTCPSVIALTGADMQPKLNGEDIPISIRYFDEEILFNTIVALCGVCGTSPADRGGCSYHG